MVDDRRTNTKTKTKTTAKATRAIAIPIIRPSDEEGEFCELLGPIVVAKSSNVVTGLSVELSEKRSETDIRTVLFTRTLNAIESRVKSKPPVFPSPSKKVKYVRATSSRK